MTKRPLTEAASGFIDLLDTKRAAARVVHRWISTAVLQCGSKTSGDRFDSGAAEKDQKPP
jgi:hypothetical protein